MFLSIALGIGLAAACGFRVFVPLLALNLAALAGQITLPEGFSWLASHLTTVALATATLAEILGYYLPWVDSLLDTIATPAAVVAGTISTAAVVTDMAPIFKWTLALIAGGGNRRPGAGINRGSARQVRRWPRRGPGIPSFPRWNWPVPILTGAFGHFRPVLCLVLLGLFFLGLLRRAWKALGKKPKNQV